MRLALVAVLLASGGCKLPQGQITSVTSSLIGIRVGLNQATQTPELQLGFFRSTFQIVPTSTNILHAPIVNSSLSMDQKAFSTSIDEMFLTGGAETIPDNPAVVGAKMRAKSPKN